MNFITILIITQFIDNVISFYLNSSLNGYLDFTSITLPRPKRGASEYTRWRTDFEPTDEFIIKVLDEDSPALNSEVAPVNFVSISSGQGPNSAESGETEKDLIRDRLIINPFLKSKVGDDNIPVYSNNKIISQKMYKGKIDTKYPKVKYMSVQNENQNALLGSRFLSKLDSPVQQFAPIESEITPERTAEPLLQMKLSSSDPKFVSQLKSKVTRTSPKDDIIAPVRTFNAKKFNPIQTLNTEIFSLRNVVTDSFSRFEYIHPIRTTIAEKPLRKLNKLFNLRTGTTKTIPRKETDAYMDIDKDEEDESMEIKTSDNKETKFFESDDANETQNECQETDLNNIMEASTEFINSTITKKYISKVTRTATISDFISRRNSGTQQINCTMVRNKGIDGSSRTLHQIVTQLKAWAENSPVAKWVDITNGNYTTMENPIYMMIVDDLSKGQIASAKETVLIVAGIQGKDHHAVSAAMSLLQELIEKSESHSDLLRKYRFWIIPVLNPDGYDYSTTFPLRRHWIKNLRQAWSLGKDDDQRACQAFGISCTINDCYGVNLDRNFEYQWIPTKELQAEHLCGSLYAGPRQLSEVETRSLTQYLDKKHIHTFIAYKEGDVLGVLYPYSHTKKKRPLDDYYRVRSLRAATAASVAGGRTYVYGQTSDYLPLYAGGIEDWVDGHLGIDNTYSIMMMTRTDYEDNQALVTSVAVEAFAATHALLFPSDYDQSHLPEVIRYKNVGTKSSTDRTILIIFVILLGNG